MSPEHPRNFLPNNGYLPMELINEEGVEETPHITIENGGSIEIGFYHESCHYSNYNEGRTAVGKPFYEADNNAESQVDVFHSMFCGRCNEEFRFLISNTMYDGVYICETNGRLEQSDIYYRNIENSEE